MIIQLLQPLVEQTSIDGQHAGIHLVHQFLLRTGILLFHDGGHLALGVADDAAIAARIVQFDGEQGQGLVSGRVH